MKYLAFVLCYKNIELTTNKPK